MINEQYGDERVCIRCDHTWPTSLMVHTEIAGEEWYLCLNCQDMVLQEWVCRTYKASVDALRKVEGEPV